MSVRAATMILRNVRSTECSVYLIIWIYARHLSRNHTQNQAYIFWSTIPAMAEPRNCRLWKDVLIILIWQESCMQAGLRKHAVKSHASRDHWLACASMYSVVRTLYSVQSTRAPATAALAFAELHLDVPCMFYGCSGALLSS